MSDFHHLTPDRVIDLAEEAMGVPCATICRPLTSYINRVYEVHREDGEAVVVKFYRPGRWSDDALRDEHDFLRELAAAEVSVIAPLSSPEGATLHRRDDLRFAVFPRRGGRVFEDPDREQWGELGRLLARTHNVGAEHGVRHRIVMAPDRSTADHVAYLLASGCIQDPSIRRQFERTAHTLIEHITPLFAERERIRIHGDCHSGNIIFRPEERFLLIDFDDMAQGPPVQDVWMLLPGYRDEVQRELDWFLDGYERFRAFDLPSLDLIEPLRSMRYLHFMAWCARQVNDVGTKRVDPEFGSDVYWRREIRDLENQLARIRRAAP